MPASCTSEKVKWEILKWGVGVALAVGALGVGVAGLLLRG